MARPLRIEFPGAIYHVTSRGNARERIFYSDDDQSEFLEIFLEVVQRYGWNCHAYCLMDNHYHLLIETTDPNLSLGMRHLNGVYTQRFNRLHGRVGHVFQGRFKAILVDRECYLLELARYIVLNPVRARMVTAVSDYQWSSYQATSGLSKQPEWLSTDWILAQFAKTRPVAQRKYREFVDYGLNTPSPWEALKGQSVLGSENFVKMLMSQIECKAELSEITKAQRMVDRPSLKTLFSAQICKSKIERDAVIHRAFHEHGYTMAAIARKIGVHYSTVSRVIRGDR